MRTRAIGDGSCRRFHGCKLEWLVGMLPVEGPSDGLGRLLGDFGLESPP